MAEEKSSIRAEMVAALKEMGVATKKDVEDIVHNQLTEFYAGRIQPEFDKAEGKNEERFQKLEQRMGGLEQRMGGLEVGQSHIRDDIKGLEGDLAATPTRREVEDIKTRVDHLERTN